MKGVNFFCINPDAKQDFELAFNMKNSILWKELSCTIGIGNLAVAGLCTLLYHHRKYCASRMQIVITARTL
uniref:Uncharacterized protein n=1 Tax=Arundo donax TaxID=35708 RepID=A0A0A8YIS1_ARUDO